MSPEVASQIAVWRQQAFEGTLTVEDQRKIIELIRGDRKNAAVSSEKARKTRAKKEIKSADDMLKELGL